MPAWFPCRPCRLPEAPAAPPEGTRPRSRGSIAGQSVGRSVVEGDLMSVEDTVVFPDKVCFPQWL